MAARIERAPESDSVRFVVAGDSGAWPDPTADGIYAQLIRQVGALEPPPLFFANLGDFAGPGTLDRHEHYLRLVEPLSIPNICVVGNHDLDDVHGLEAFVRVHGPVNFGFAHAHARFVVLRSVPGELGSVEVAPGDTEGPREDDLVFLDSAFAGAEEPNRIVLMHMPPFLEGHYAPHEEWGFRRRESDFLALLRAHGVTLVCCAHGLAFDTVVHDGIRFVMSGGGGTGLCSHYRGVCTQGDGRPEDRGALFHAVELVISSIGDVSGRVIQAFDESGGRITF